MPNKYKVYIREENDCDYPIIVDSAVDENNPKEQAVIQWMNKNKNEPRDARVYFIEKL